MNLDISVVNILVLKILSSRHYMLDILNVYISSYTG